MKEEEIKKYIDKLNNREAKETIFLRRLNVSVDLARVWEKEPQLNDNTSISTPSYRFFFIRDENNKYVGAVLDMYKDLFWYVLKEERKKGYLTKALKEAIIPYLFYDEFNERDEQRITINKGIGKVNYNNSRKVAEGLGFVPINEDESEFILSRDKFDWEYENIEEKNGSISAERFRELRNRLILSFRQTFKISDELLMAYCDDKGLRAVARELSYFSSKLEDIEYENISDKGSNV